MSSMIVPHAPTSAALARHRFVDELRGRGLPGLVVDDATLVLLRWTGGPGADEVIPVQPGSVEPT